MPMRAGCSSYKGQLLGQAWARPRAAAGRQRTARARTAGCRRLLSLGRHNNPGRHDSRGVAATSASVAATRPGTGDHPGVAATHRSSRPRPGRRHPGEVAATWPLVAATRTGSWRPSRSRRDLWSVATGPGSWRRGAGRDDLTHVAATPGLRRPRTGREHRSRVVATCPRSRRPPRRRDHARVVATRRPALESRDYGVVINVARPAATLESGDYALTVVRLHVPSEMIVSYTSTAGLRREG